MSEALRECPFCGGDAMLLANAVICKKCHGNTGGQRDGAEAIELWNRRTETANEALTLDIVRCGGCKHGHPSKDALEFDGVTPLIECGYSKMPNRPYEFCSWGKHKPEGSEG
jgi:hypothetical protein